MMKHLEIKLFEIRDRATFIPAMAIRIDRRHVPSLEDNFLIARAGYGLEPYVVFGRLDGGQFNYDVYSWGGRTMPVAHQHIEVNWGSLTSGDVIDVEFILGEVTEPKRSERLDSGGL